jgi:hypothetical protein
MYYSTIKKRFSLYYGRNSKRLLGTTVHIRNPAVYHTLGKGYLKYMILTIHHNQGE